MKRNINTSARNQYRKSCNNNTHKRLPELEHPSPTNSQFNVGELRAAQLSARNTMRIPDKTIVTVLKNLAEEGKTDLLEWFMQVWKTERLPEAWNLCTLTLIFKSGKLTDSMQNLEPIPLTSNLCKNMKRRVLPETTWLHEVHNQPYCARKTSLRPSLSTQDCLALICEQVTFQQPRYNLLLIVEICIKKALGFVFMTRSYAAQWKGESGEKIFEVHSLLFQWNEIETAVGQNQGSKTDENMEVQREM